jgi:hypothetical protein
MVKSTFPLLNIPHNYSSHMENGMDTHKELTQTASLADKGEEVGQEGAMDQAFEQVPPPYSTTNN